MSARSMMAMPIKQWRSPQFDRMVERLARGLGGRDRDARSGRIAERAAALLRAVQRIEPRMEGNDKTWTFWLRTERGSLADYGSLDELRDEGMVESAAQVEALWHDETGPLATET
jgi:hypothetical protein